MPITAQFVRAARASPTMSKSDSKQHAPPLPPTEQTHTTSPHDNDVLCGRGGCINSHPGNEQYRSFVDRKKRVYLTARFKREKRLIAESIVAEVRNLDPPGRFLTKDNGSNIWYDIGDEKARDKTSQALRENATSVRKEIEEENRETRRQQAREVAIAAGRDPDEAEKNVMGAEAAAAAQTKSVNEDKNRHGGGSPNRLDGEPYHDGIVIPPKSGFGAPSYGQQPSMMPPPPQWGYNTQGGPPHPHPNAPHPSANAAYNPHSHPPHSHYTQQGSYYSQPQHQPHPPPPPSASYHHSHSHAAHGTHPPPPPNAAHPSQYPPPPSTTYQHPTSSSNWEMPPPPSNPPTQHEMHPPAHTSHPHPPPPQHGHHHALPPRPGSYPLSSTPADSRQVQFQNLHPQHLPPPQQQHQPQSYRDTINETATTTQPPLDIPLIINSRKKPSTKGFRPQPRTQPSSNRNTNESSYGSLILNQDPNPQQQQRPLSPQPSILSSLAGGTAAGEVSNMSQCTPLDFMSNFSVKSSDTLNYLIGDMDDDIVGDVGQEVELVAHAPLAQADTEHNDTGEEDIREPTSPRSRCGAPVSSMASTSTYNKSEYSTPPRHSKSRRRRRRGGDHIPSNSGKVQVDWSLPTHAATGRGNAVSSSSSKGGGLPCTGGPTNTCGGILPSPIVARSSRRSSNNTTGVASPMAPMSPVHSLDFDKMSLCGTDVLSHGGGSVGGASLCNVFEEHGSVAGASVLMDMSMSLGSHPSSGGSAATPAPGGHRGYALPGAAANSAFHPSMFGEGALMDMSVGSESQSKAPSQGSSGSQSKAPSQGSSGSRGSRQGSGRSISPASVDKNAIDAHDSLPLDGQDFTWGLDGKSTE